MPITGTAEVPNPEETSYLLLLYLCIDWQRYSIYSGFDFWIITASIRIASRKCSTKMQVPKQTKRAYYLQLHRTKRKLSLIWKQLFASIQKILREFKKMKMIVLYPCSMILFKCVNSCPIAYYPNLTMERQTQFVNTYTLLSITRKFRKKNCS